MPRVATSPQSGPTDLPLSIVWLAAAQGCRRSKRMGTGHLVLLKTVCPIQALVNARQGPDFTLAKGPIARLAQTSF